MAEGQGFKGPPRLRRGVLAGVLTNRPNFRELFHIFPTARLLQSRLNGGFALSSDTIRVGRGSSEWLRASLQPATLLGLIMIAACWVAVAFVMSVEHGKTLEASIQQSESLVRLFEKDVAQTLSGIDRTLLLLRNAYEADPTHFDLRRWTELTADAGDLTIQSSIFGPDGFMRATTTDYNGPPLNVGDREHFLAHVHSGTDRLFISKPVVGRASGKLSIQLSRPIRGPNGQFGGIIIASLDPDFIGKFYETVELGSHGSVILRALDGVILAERGVPDFMIGRQGFTGALRDALARAPTGYYWGGGAIDGVDRLVGYRVFERFPLIGTVGRAESVIFATYRHNQDNYLAVAAIVSILGMIAIAGAIRYQVRLERARNKLRRSEAETRERAHELEVTLEYMSQGIIMTDADNNVPVINRRAIELLHLPESSPIDLPTTADLLKSDQGCIGLEPGGPEQSIKSSATSNDIQVYQRTLPDGVVLEIHNASLKDGGTVRTISDITERIRAEQEIVHIAHHDALTGLANRLLLRNHVDQAFGGARQYGESFAILCLDLDRFKIANDTFGHQAGDVLLRNVADRLRVCARDVDTVARVGGDEFVVLQAKVTKADDAAALAQRILRAVSAPYEVNGNPVVMSASIGIAVVPSDGASADEILSHADLALYNAKANGRNAFRFFDSEMEQTALRRGRLESELRDALTREEFALWYQPWFNITSGRIVGCEALLRWRHPQRGLLGPVEFLSIAEETGLIGRLGDWVLRRGCQDAAGWPKDVKLAINLSAAQFIGGKLYGSVIDALVESGLAARRLELEITETLIIDDFEGTREALTQLRSRGISVALDDFGTGYSSLTHLRQLLFDRIKIDKSFVAEVTTRAECAAIVSAVIALGNSLGVCITAEGVETDDQLTILRAAGCTEVQGYLFSRPISGAKILERLSARNTNVAAA
jgi:diguanylate cyclase (GGDEF)-like protein